MGVKEDIKMIYFLEPEFKERRIKECVSIIKDMEKDEIGFSVEEMWGQVMDSLLGYDIPHEVSRKYAISSFRKCGYTVEE